MAHVRKKLVAYPGRGELHFRGFTGLVDYEILGELAKLKPGPLRLRGSFTADNDVAEAAFKASEGVLEVEGAGRYRITMLGHTAGSGVTYFEMRA